MSALPASGVYVIEIRLNEPQIVSVGRLGQLSFPAGAYLYVGRARRGLPARIARHARKAKPLRWHADYLTARGIVTRVAVWPQGATSECGVAAALGRQLPVVSGFGSSDCRCAGHLFQGALGMALRTLPATHIHSLPHTE